MKPHFAMEAKKEHMADLRFLYVLKRKPRRAHKPAGVFFREERDFGNEASVMFPSLRYT